MVRAEAGYTHACARGESLEDEPGGGRLLRKEAIRVLGRLGDGRAVEQLIAELAHENPALRSSATEALRAIGDPRTAGPLIQALDDDARSVRKHA